LFHIKEESVNLGIICEFLISFGIILGFAYIFLFSEPLKGWKKVNALEQRNKLTGSGS